MKAICDDLEAETAALSAVVSHLTEDQWRLPTPAAGWDSHETIIHLGQADWAASLAVVDPEGFVDTKARMLAGEFSLDRAAEEDVGSMSGAQVWQWFEGERSRMIEAFRALGAKDRIPWFGPDMSALSFATARLMETWSHGADVADTFGSDWPSTDRLRHVAHIGVTTRGWSYVNRGREIPEGTVRVELSAPSGDIWTWGPDEADAKVSGSALDFCLLATQRRHRSEVALVADGALADEWLDIAQAFAGPATNTRGPG
ncbi:MAG: hypothetical protein ACI8Y4_001138 [Candidatus Poriferisodalaceae bacterium]|jgi:uncharacterized protein (TIGR03084 family)